jgi:hypothetical protein
VLLLLVVRTVVVIDFIAGVVLRTVLLSDLLLLLFSIMATALAVLIIVSRAEFLGRSKHSSMWKMEFGENLGRSFVSEPCSRGRSFIRWKLFGRDADVTGSDRAGSAEMKSTGTGRRNNVSLLLISVMAAKHCECVFFRPFNYE